MYTTTNPRPVAALIVLVCLSVSASAQHLTDPQITRSLEQAFQRDVRLRDADIRVSTAMGRATLTGTVASYVDRHTAEQIAKRTVGVRSVINSILLDLGVRRDSDIAQDVQRRLSQSRFVRPIKLDVQVATGVVTLTGAVPTWAQSHQAEVVAREVRGVKLVRNNLTVRGLTALAGRSDDEIRADVKAELSRDAYLSEMPIQVSVEGGVVRLEGEVPNLFHRERASEEARLGVGVRSVDNQLVVISQMILNRLPEPPTDVELRRVVLEE